MAFPVVPFAALEHVVYKFISVLVFYPQFCFQGAVVVLSFQRDGLSLSQCCEQFGRHFSILISGSNRGLERERLP